MFREDLTIYTTPATGTGAIWALILRSLQTGSRQSLTRSLPPMLDPTHTLNLAARLNSWFHRDLYQDRNTGLAGPRAN